MYKISQIVSCGTTGLCRISALTERSVDGKPVQYYQLDPLRSSGATVLIPTGSESLLRRLRQIDEAAWKDAERLLCDEFSYVLGTEPHEILPRLRVDIQ